MKDSTLETLKNYVAHGYEPGHFIRAVLENDFMEAFARADYENTRDMHEIASYVYNKLPRNAWGSPEAVDEWLEKKRE